MESIFLVHPRIAVRSTWLIAILSMILLIVAALAYTYEWIGFAAGASFMGIITTVIAISRSLSLSHQKWWLAFDQDRLAIEWSHAGQHVIKELKEFISVSYSHKMRADGISDSAVSFGLRSGQALNLPTEFCDVLTIDQIKAICQQHGVLFIDCRDNDQI
jgi:hypothetical protein